MTVHNHGTEDGPGLSCPEQHIDGKLRGACMGERKLVSTYYRSLTQDGAVWCESRDLAEVRRMSAGEECTFEVTHFYEVTDGWQEWAL